MTKLQSSMGLLELAERCARAIQVARDEIGATEQQRIAFMYAEAAMRSELRAAIADRSRQAETTQIGSVHESGGSEGNRTDINGLQDRVRRLEEALTKLSSSFTGGWAGMYRERAEVIAEVESIARTALGEPQC